MNILQINNYAGPSDFCPPYRPNHLAREWVRQGHHVAIVGASYSHLFFKLPSFRGSLLRLVNDGAEYFLLRTPKYEGNGVGRTLNMLTFAAQLWRFGDLLARETKPDVVIAGSTHLLDTPPALWLARKRGARLVREIRDLWPLTPIELGGMSRIHPFVLLIQQAERYAYRNADRVVTTLPRSRPYMQRQGLAVRKWRYIPQGVDPIEWKQNDLPVPELHRATLLELKRKGSFVVGYTGSLGLAYGLPTVVEAASIVSGDNIAIVFVGQGGVKADLLRKVEKLKLQNVYFLPPVPKSCLPGLLSLFDAVLMSWARQPIFRYGVSPNKLMDYMMAARPVVYAISDGNDLVAEAGCGVSVPAEDPHALAKGIWHLKAMSPEDRERMGEKGKDYVTKHHLYVNLARQYLDAVC